MRWHYRDAGLLWLFLPAYAIHIAEEWFAGFPQWIAAVAGQPLPAAAFFVINGVGLVLLAIGVRAAVRAERSGWIAIAIATIALVNTASHAAGVMLTRGYAPGLISAVVLYVPLGLLTLVRAVDHAPHDQVPLGVAAGLVIHAALFAIAFSAARLAG